MDRFIRTGRILRPVGLKGRVLIQAYSDPENILQPGSFSLRSPSGRYEEFFISSATFRGPMEFITSLRWVDTREKARRLSGMEVYQRFSRLPPREEDEFYWFELEGLEVLDIHGRFLGRVHSVMDTGAGDVLVVRDRAREILIPMVEDIIMKIDTKVGQMTVELPPGLEEATETRL